jgi:hypothetical protein
MKAPYLVLTTVAALACSSGGAADSPVAASVGGPFVLAPGQTATVPGHDLTITFLAVQEDSRCPRDVVCVWSGNARVQLEVAREGVELPVGLNTAVEPNAAPVGDDLLVVLEGLVPAPTTTGPIDPADYRATLEVREAGR